MQPRSRSQPAHLMMTRIRVGSRVTHPAWSRCLCAPPHLLHCPPRAAAPLTLRRRRRDVPPAGALRRQAPVRLLGTGAPQRRLRRRSDLIREGSWARPASFLGHKPFPRPSRPSHKRERPQNRGGLQIRRQFLGSHLNQNVLRTNKDVRLNGFFY